MSEPARVESGARGTSEKRASSLDDELDRSELRDRYYGLLELRVVVTGVQVLLAFLLTVPFAQRFALLDSSSQAWFGVALLSAALSVVAFVTPTALHRFGPRTARAERLQLSVLATRAGLLFLAVAMIVSVGVVSSLLFGGIVVGLLVATLAVATIGLWVIAPLMVRRGN